MYQDVPDDMTAAEFENVWRERNNPDLREALEKGDQEFIDAERTAAELIAVHSAVNLMGPLTPIGEYGSSTSLTPSSLSTGTVTTEYTPIRPSPGQHVTGKAPTQVTPGIKTLDGVHINDQGREEPWVAHYDEYGRLKARTDYNAGNKEQNIPDVHHHIYEYGPGYEKGREVFKHAPGEYTPSK